MIAMQFARLIANFEIFLELTDDDELDPDDAGEFGEFLGDQLQSLDHGFLREFVDAFPSIAKEYSDEVRKSVSDIPFGYYLEEELAAEDPIKLAELEAVRDAHEY